ncbi:hypothetical protein PBC5_069 [Bacillus phage PBC5]|nr:hypothetical protein PBC5_069 [Bacillus phage PBC5]
MIKHIWKVDITTLNGRVATLTVITNEHDVNEVLEVLNVNNSCEPNDSITCINYIQEGLSK